MKKKIIHLYVCAPSRHYYSLKGETRLRFLMKKKRSKKNFLQGNSNSMDFETRDSAQMQNSFSITFLINSLCNNHSRRNIFLCIFFLSIFFLPHLSFLLFQFSTKPHIITACKIYLRSIVKVEDIIVYRVHCMKEIGEKIDFSPHIFFLFMILLYILFSINTRHSLHFIQS